MKSTKSFWHPDGEASSERIFAGQIYVSDGPNRGKYEENTHQIAFIRAARYRNLAIQRGYDDQATIFDILVRYDVSRVCRVL